MTDRQTIPGTEVRVGDEIEHERNGITLRGVVGIVAGALWTAEDGHLGGISDTFTLLHRPTPPTPPLPTEPLSIIRNVVTKGGGKWPLGVHDGDDVLQWRLFDGEGCAEVYDADQIASWEPYDPAPAPEPRVVTSAAELALLPRGSVVLDRDGDAWQRSSGDWRTGCWAARDSATLASEHGPFTVLHTGGDDE